MTPHDHGPAGRPRRPRGPRRRSGHSCPRPAARPDRPIAGVPARALQGLTGEYWGAGAEHAAEILVALLAVRASEHGLEVECDDTRARIVLPDGSLFVPWDLADDGALRAAYAVLRRAGVPPDAA